MKKKWKAILCIALAAVFLGGSLIAWRLCFPPDTDPEAPFKDLPDREKKKILTAIETFWREKHDGVAPEFFWYGELAQNQSTPLSWRNYNFGVRYYGTFGGYHIVVFPFETMDTWINKWEIAGYTFWLTDDFYFLAYKDGTVETIRVLYKDGRLSEEQIGLIHQCFERYNEQMYIYRSPWEEE